MGLSSSEHGIDWDQARRLIRARLLERCRPEDRDDLEDLVQESCVRLLRAASTSEAHNVGGLATIVARRTWVDYVRRKVRARSLFSTPDAMEPAADESATGLFDVRFGGLAERLELIVQEIFQETGGDACLELARAYFDERDWSSVSSELGTSHAAVRKRWSRCVETLRKVMFQDPDLRSLFQRAGATGREGAGR